MQSNQTKGTLIVFCRWPEPGRTMTRLVPRLGPVGAANLHRALVEHTLRTVRAVVGLRRLSLEIHHTGEVKAMRDWLGTDLKFRAQTSGDLGTRMWAALNHGPEPAVLVGTDCPELNGDILEAAFAVLDRRAAVLGPATDGGYYLIGGRHLPRAVFRDIRWGGSEVLAHTRARLTGAGLSWGEVASLADIDRPEDLTRLPQHLLPALTAEDT